MQAISREFCGFLSDPQNIKAQKFGENFGAFFFVRNSCLEKNISCQLRSADVPTCSKDAHLWLTSWHRTLSPGHHCQMNGGTEHVNRTMKQTMLLTMSRDL